MSEQLPDKRDTAVQVEKPAFQLGQAPLKIVTGSQRTSELNFALQPGAIIAHPGAKVIFVCG